MLNVATEGWSMLMLLLFLGLGGWVDLRANRIPNAIVLNGILVALVLHELESGPAGLAEALAGLLVAGGLLLPFHLGGGMGAGDVKLMAMVGAFLGPDGALPAVAMSLIAGLVLAVAVLLGSQAMQSRLALGLRASIPVNLSSPRRQGAAERRRAGTLRFPYAVAILVGTLASLWLFDDLQPAGGLVGMLWTR